MSIGEGFGKKRMEFKIESNFSNKKKDGRCQRPTLSSSCFRWSSANRSGFKVADREGTQ